METAFLYLKRLCFASFTTLPHFNLRVLELQLTHTSSASSLTFCQSNHQPSWCGWIDNPDFRFEILPIRNSHSTTCLSYLRLLAAYSLLYRFCVVTLRRLLISVMSTSCASGSSPPLRRGALLYCQWCFVIEILMTPRWYWDQQRRLMTATMTCFPGNSNS